ncbi:MAG: hypothetical protein D6725_04545 [Planctomycetota bacterium]|nr:MAG: hypothetical protein D6725_04545 [Planctomycetota bacterium]
MRRSLWTDARACGVRHRLGTDGEDRRCFGSAGDEQKVQEMARRERDREDLMRDATGLSPRGQLRLIGCGEPLVAGFGRRGELRVYFSPERMLQWDAEGGLRRAFWDGRLMRTQGDYLAVLTRQRRSNRTELLHRPMSDEEREVFLAEVCRRCGALVEALRAGDARILRVVGADAAAFAERLARHLSVVLERIESGCWLAPPIPTRRR